MSSADERRFDELIIDAGIAVSSTPVAVNHATADVGIFLMIGALRQAYVPLSAIRAGEFQVKGVGKM